MFTTYTFQFCPVNDGEGAVADHQLGGRDDVHHLSSPRAAPPRNSLSHQCLNVSIELFFCYHTDCLEVILLVADLSIF